MEKNLSPRDLPGLTKDPILAGLACAVLEPGLRSILLLDCPPPALLQAAQLFSALLAVVEPEPFPVVLVNNSESEETLWGELRPNPDPGPSRPPFSWRRGRVTAAPGDETPRLLVLPDVAHLDLPASRACVSLIGADVASLERHGQHFTWQPRDAWLGAIKITDVGEITPHLLDRFALRLSGPAAQSVDPVAELLERISRSAWHVDEQLAEVPAGVALALRSGFKRCPAFAPGVVRSVGLYLPASLSDGKALGQRRELTLLRLTRGLARLQGADFVELDHLAAAAGLLGLSKPALVSSQPAVDITEQPESSPREAQETIEQPAPDTLPAPAPQPGPQPTGPLTQPVIQPDAEQAFPPSSLAPPPDPYPEDHAQVTREMESLRLPPYQQASAAANGPIIGTQRAGGLADIALVATVLEAAKYQRVRPPLPGAPGAFRILRPDLRSYRRASARRFLLVLVLDYTSLAGCDWESALLPHLIWAYVQRAGITLIKIGAKGAAQPLAAELLSVRSLLSPQLSAALALSPGDASPLAHGLDLACRALHGDIQHGRSRVQHARLVVFTDGRGNVPLESSRTGRITAPVYRQGVDDALRAAEELSDIDELERVVLHPRPDGYPELPIQLAQALGARLEAAPLKLLSPQPQEGPAHV